jgi:hypothetical protein
MVDAAEGHKHGVLKAGFLFDNTLKFTAGLIGAGGVPADAVMDFLKDKLKEKVQDGAVRIIAAGPEDELDLGFLATAATSLVKLSLVIASHTNPAGVVLAMGYALYVWLDAKDKEAQKKWNLELAGRLQTHYDNCRAKAAARLAAWAAKEEERIDLHNATQFDEDEAKYMLVSWVDPALRRRTVVHYRALRITRTFYKELCAPKPQDKTKDIPDLLLAQIFIQYRPQIIQYNDSSNKPDQKTLKAIAEAFNKPIKAETVAGDEQVVWVGISEGTTAGAVPKFPEIHTMPSGSGKKSG